MNIQTLFKLGRVVLSKATEEYQRLQAYTVAGEATNDDVRHLSQYGFESNPNAGAEALVVSLNEDDELIILVADARYRVKGLAAGEVAMYDDSGQSISMRKSPTRISIVSPRIENSDTAAALTAPQGVVTGEAIDPYTGQTLYALGAASTIVFARR